MGCSSSKPNPQQQQPVRAAPPAASVAPPAGASKGKGKGKGTAKGKGKGKGKGMPKRDAKEVGKIMQGKFQIMLSQKWQDYDKDEDQILKRAFLIGQPNCRFQLRGQSYEYDFKKRLQKNLATGKEREIRPPRGMTSPGKPLLPAGPMVVCSVPQKMPQNYSMMINDPNNPGKKVQVALPPNAKPGQRIAVPVPDKGQSMEQVAKKQQEWSKGAKLALAAAALGPLAVGGVVLGEHLSGGAISAWGEEAVADAGAWIEGTGAVDWAAGAAEDAGDWAAGAAEDVGDWATGAAEDVGDWATGAAEDVGDWATGAAEDIGDWGAGAADDIADFAGDAGDWFGDAAEDVGDFVTSLF